MGYNKNAAVPSRMTLALAEVGYSLKDAAEEFGVGYQHLVNIARGRTHASEPVIAGFKRLTGHDLADYADPWVTDKQFDPKFRDKK